MEHINFLPLWYREKIEKRNKIKISIFIIIILIATAFNFIKTINYEIVIKNIKYSMEEQLSKKRQEIINKERIIKDKNAMVSVYNSFINDIDNKYNVDYFEISKAEILLQKNCNNNKIMYDLIKCVEKNKKYEIKNINMGNIKGDEAYLKMNLKIK